MADLIFPRLMYRGDADVLGTGYADEAMHVKLHHETRQVHNQAEFDDAKDNGWRETREDPTDPKTIAAKKAADDKAARVNPNGGGTVATLRTRLATVTTAAELEQIRAAELAHPDYTGGRATALKAIDDRRAELGL